MSIIKQYSQWINEEASAAVAPAAATPAAPTQAAAAPAAPAQTYTLKANNITYKYPFTDDTAYANYLNFEGKDEASMKAALAKIVPSLQTEPIKMADGSPAIGSKVLTLTKSALDLHAKLGWQKAATLEQMLAVPASPLTEAELKQIKEISSAILTPERKVEWNKNWPTVWKEQCTKANLVFTAPAAPVVGK
jgi:hypothetical protein